MVPECGRPSRQMVPLPNAMDTRLPINGTRVPGADQRIGRDCVGCLMYEVDSASTERQRLDRLTDLFDRQTVSVMRQMGAWTRPGEERSTRNDEHEIVSNTTATIEAEMHGIIALSSSVDDRFREGARIIRPTTGSHRIRPVDDSRQDVTSVVYRVEPYDSDIGHVIGGGFRRRDT